MQHLPFVNLEDANGRVNFSSTREGGARHEGAAEAESHGRSVHGACRNRVVNCLSEPGPALRHHKAEDVSFMRGHRLLKRTRRYS